MKELDKIIEALNGHNQTRISLVEEYLFSSKAEKALLEYGEYYVIDKVDPEHNRFALYDSEGTCKVDGTPGKIRSWLKIRSIEDDQIIIR